MKCPSCQKTLKPNSTICKHCGVRIVRKSDKIARRMTTNARVSIASGGLLAFIAIVLAFYGAYTVGGITLCVGAALMVIGKMMD